MWGVFGWRWLWAWSPSARKVRFLVCVCVSCRLTCCVYKGRLMSYVHVPCDSLRSTLIFNARAIVLQSMAEQGSASLGHLASVHSPLLRQCQGGVALLTSTNGPSLFSLAKFWGFVFHLLSSFSNPKFGLFTISRLRARGVGQVLTVTRILISRRRPSSATCFARFYYG